MNREIITMIDIGSSTIKLVMAEYKQGVEFSNILSFSEIESSGIIEGNIVNKKDAALSIGALIKKVEKESGIAIKNIIILSGNANSNTYFKQASISFPDRYHTIKREDISGLFSHIEHEITVEHPNEVVTDISPFSFIVDDSISYFEPLGFKAYDLTVAVNVFTLSVNDLEMLHTIFNELGVTIQKITPRVNTLSRILLSKKQMQQGIIIADLGAETLTLSAFIHGVLYKTKSWGIGSQDITNDLSQGLGIPFDQAEKIKVTREIRMFSAEQTKLIPLIIEARFMDIFEVINSWTIHIQHDFAFSGGILLTGGGFLHPMGIQIAKRSLALPLSTPYQELILHYRRKFKKNSWYPVLGGILLEANELDEVGMNSISLVHLFSYWLKKIRDFFIP